MSQIFQRVKQIFKSGGNISLTHKAALNAAASGSEYFVQMLIQFIITPLMVNGFGDYFYGVWQIINRLFSYISTTAGSASPLEWTLAKEQSLDNPEEKRRYIGASLVIWALLLPVTAVFGGVITWFAPYWLNTPAENFLTVRIVAAIFIVTEFFTSLSFIPYAILRGQNQGYRRLGLSLVLIVFNGFLIWLALKTHTGIIGVSIAVLIQIILKGLFYTTILKSAIPWIGILRPPVDLVKKFFKLSGWYLASDVVSNLTFASDVVVLGLLGSVEAVPAYTLTKYVPETVISVIAIVVVGIIPGLSGIVGTGDLKKASQVRNEIVTLTWFIVTVIGATILVWNRHFLGLWVGSERFAGGYANLLIVLVIVQFVLIRTDGVIIDLSLKMQKKVLYGTVSVVLAVAISSILVKYFHMGIVGISWGLLIGRLLLSITYPTIVSRFLGESFSSQLKSLVRPAVVTALVFASASLLDGALEAVQLSGISGWLILVAGTGLTAVLAAFVVFYAGLSHGQRGKLISRFETVLKRQGSALQ